MPLRSLWHPQRVEHADEGGRGRTVLREVAHRDHHVGPDHIGCSGHRCPRLEVGVVVDSGIPTGALLDDDIEAVLRERLDPGGYEGHSLLPRRGFAQHS